MQHVLMPRLMPLWIGIKFFKKSILNYNLTERNLIEKFLSFLCIFRDVSFLKLDFDPTFSVNFANNSQQSKSGRMLEKAQNATPKIEFSSLEGNYPIVYQILYVYHRYIILDIAIQQSSQSVGEIQKLNQGYTHAYIHICNIFRFLPRGYSWLNKQ